MKKSLLLLSLFVASILSAAAQIVTSNPPLLTQSSQNIVLTYHPDASESNKALANLPSSTAIYAHIGLITSNSTGASDWKYAPKWLDNAAKYKLTYVSANTYTLNIGDFKSYFGLADGETVERIAMVFRDATGSKEGKTMAGGDIFIDVHPDGFNVSLVSSNNEGIASVGESITLTVAASENAELTLDVNGTQLAHQASANELKHTYKFPALGAYTFTATAKSTSGQTVTKQFKVTVPESSKQANYPGGTPKMGAVKNADGTVTFCLAAPGKKTVILVPSWDNYEVRNENVMAYQDYNGNRYFWITVSGLDNSTPYPYYFIVDGTTKVADPYAHLVLDCYSDKYLDKTVWPDCPQYPYERFDNTMLAVYQCNIDDYKFSNFTIPAHDNLIIYELLLRDFTGTEGAAEGNGTIRQAIEKIPYLVDLGVNAVELMPIMEFNGNNSWGYNTNFYMAPDKAYGSPKDYKDFIEICHQNGIAVILDIVFNQSDGLHPWYQMYPIESNPFYNKVAPHDYSVLNDWNQDNSLVWQQWQDAITYWMTAYNVDGFRFDLVKGLGSNSSYGSGTEAYNSSRVTNTKRLHSFITACKPNGIHINENLAGGQEETEMANDGQLLWANFSHNCAQFAMGYDEDTQGGKMSQMWDSYGRPAGSIIAYAESHDEERTGYKITANAPTAIKSKANKCRRIGAMAAQLLLIPGPKMIWQFGELAADQSTKNSSGNNTDPKKVIWSRMDDATYEALHDVFRALISLRKDNPDIWTSGVQFIPSGMDGSMSKPRTLIIRNGSKEVVVFINANTSGSAISVTASTSYLSASNSQLICATYKTTPTLSGTGTVSVSLEPNSFAVFATNNVAGLDDITLDNQGDDFIVLGGQGCIDIIGEYTTAVAYTLDGRQVALDNLQAGIYVVNVDGRSFKVSVN